MSLPPYRYAWLRMSGSADVATLRQFLVSQYAELKRVLARRLGSDDLAGEVLQETYLRLLRPLRIRDVNNPRRYLLTIATNIARMGFRRERSWTSLSELDTIEGLVDETSGPLQALEARQDIEALQRVFAELTPRRRRILLASRVDGTTLRDIATQLGVSQRAVEKELKSALALCGHRMDRVIVQRFGPRCREVSATAESLNAVRGDAQ